MSLFGWDLQPWSPYHGNVNICICSLEAKSVDMGQRLSLQHGGRCNNIQNGKEASEVTEGVVIERVVVDVTTFKMARKPVMLQKE